MIWIVGMLCTVVAVLAIRQRDLITAAYYQGYRACVKEAVILIKDIETEAMRDAPPGELIAGVVRAETAHECEMAVRDLSYRVGRPI